MKTQERAEAIRAVRNRAEQERLEFFHDPLRYAFATVPVRDHRETWAIRSRDFKLWITSALYDFLGFAPSPLVKELTEEFETRAICRGSTHEIFVRVGETDDAAYIDLVNDRWQVIEITAEGWRVLDDSPVKFRRSSGMLGLPYPAEGNVGALRRFLNFRSRGDEVLMLAWLTFALCSGGPYPIALLSGVQGSAKSTASWVLRSLIDPSEAAVTTRPRTERDLAIAATNGHLLAIDNLREIPAELSDALCRVATDGAFRTRRLYTDNEELILRYIRSIILNGIGLDHLTTEGDMLDRAIPIHFDLITERQRIDRRTFRREFEKARPGLFGAVLDVVCAGLRDVESVEVPELPRMAEFAKWGVAIEQKLGCESGEFLTAYRENIEKANDIGAEASPIFLPIRALLERRRRFFGTAVELLEQLTLSATDLAKRHPKWPKAPNQLSAEIMRVEPNLEKAGVLVSRGRNRRGRFIVLELRESRARDDGGEDSAEPSSPDKSSFANAMGAS